MTKDASTDVREELASVAASLRAYLEWQQDTGAMGIPRRTRAKTDGNAEVANPTTTMIPAEPEPAPARGPAAARSPFAPPPSVSVSATASASALVSPPVLVVTPPAIAVPQPPPLAFPQPPPLVHTPPGPASAQPPAPPSVAPRRPLAVIAAEASTCTKCALATTRTNVVFSRGNPEARLCFVGEAPGMDEDAQGSPFVGVAGQLLDKMIGAMGLDPAKDVYICNIIKCRPPANRKPEPIEVETCIPYLHEQLAVVEPKVIVALGNTAVAALLGSKLGISKMRGQWKLYRGKIPVMPTYHPSHLLRQTAGLAEAKKQAWEDLQAVMKDLGLPLRKA